MIDPSRLFFNRVLVLSKSRGGWNTMIGLRVEGVIIESLSYDLSASFLRSVQDRQDKAGLSYV